MDRRIPNNSDFLDYFNLSSISKRVFLSIIEYGESTVTMLAERLNLPKSTIYDSIPPLLQSSLINEYNNNRSKSYGISDKSQINHVYEERVKSIKNAQSELIKLINNIKISDTVSRPKIRFYSGILGIKQAFRDMPWRKDVKECYLLWPTKKMLDIDEDFFRWHGSQRFKYNVFIYAIENHVDRSIQKNSKHKWLHEHKANLVSLRFLPPKSKIDMSFWLYGNKCLFASGGDEKIAFIIHSKEFASVIKVLWTSLWNQCGR